jgi:hypothetical protein
MKKKLFSRPLLLSSIIVAIALMPGCKKEKEKTGCKTCKASGIDRQPVEKEVCTAEEEKEFRDDNPGSEVTCN